jgi:quercetin dioxygenase-like cupin family protein
VPAEAPDRDRVVVPPGAGETITSSDRREAALLAVRDEITITSYRLAGGESGPEPHVHREHTDAFYVLEGELGFLLGPEREPIRVAAGGLVAVPPGVVHTFVNEGEEEVAFLNLHAPDGGFAAYMRARRDGDESASFDSERPPDDGGRPRHEALVSHRGEGERLRARKRLALLKCAMPSLCVIEFELEGELAGPDPHDHDDHVDSFYVLEGELSLLAGESEVRAAPGTLASVPRHVRHAFSHPWPGRARFLNLHAPEAGFAEFLRGTSQPEG